MVLDVVLVVGRDILFLVIILKKEGRMMVERFWLNLR